MKWILGNLNKGLGTFFDYFFEASIFVVGLLVSLFKSVQQVLVTILLFGGCFVILILFSVISLSVRSWPFLLFFLTLVFPLVGPIAISYLKYLQYMITEYFYEKADYYLLGKNVTYEKMGDYGRRYQRKVQEEERKAQEEAFRQSFEDFLGGGNFYWHFGPFEQGDFQEEFYRRSQGGYYQQAQGHSPDSFRTKYEEAISTLGLSPQADKYEIKLAYRKMAKLYHPDINKEEGATQKFQQINDAYEFLNDDNIARYQRMN